MNRPFLVTVEFPHDWQNGYSSRYATLEEAEAEAATLVRGNPGSKGYCKVSIYSLVREAN